MEEQKKTIEDFDLTPDIVAGIKKGLKLMKDGTLEGLAKLDMKYRTETKVMYHLIAKDVFAYRYCADNIKEDRILTKYVLSKKGMLLQNVLEKYKDDKEMVLAAVKECPYALQFASPNMRNDIDVVYEAVKKCGRALTYASPILRKNPGLIDIAFEVEGAPFIIEPKAMKIFEKLDERMIRKVVSIDFTTGERYVDMKKLESNRTYRKYKKFYCGMKMTTQQMLDMQKDLFDEVNSPIRQLDDTMFLEEWE